MKITVWNVKAYAHEVMDKRQIRDFNKFFRTKYPETPEGKEELISNESAETLFQFYGD